MAVGAVVWYISSFSLGLGAIPWLMMSEIFPTRTRGLAASVATCLNWTLSFAVTETFAMLNDYLGEDGTFWLFAAVCFCGVAGVLVAVPKTKGKSLEKIEDCFSGRSPTAAGRDGGAGGGGVIVIAAATVSAAAAAVALFAVPA